MTPTTACGGPTASGSTPPSDTGVRRNSPNGDSSSKKPSNTLLPIHAVSTAFATQLATKEWHRQLGGDIIADAILDRIVHNAIWINTGEYNMSQRHGQAMLDN